MKDGSFPDAALQDAVTRYCHALHFADGAALQALCNARFMMQWVGADGLDRAIDKAAFVARVGGRSAAAGEPVFEILSVDADNEMAQVKLNVSVPPRTYTDQLGFLRVAGSWQLMTKLFRVADGPAMEV
ncbi:hypothetical protein GCM10010873_22460 [Cypionkella aquatica]|uniref:Nuclear transport factor 2 family protein n=1 Tax=Cypionkella aquatica TaxID=1756042 RepID=A0AA37X0I7_9RHOB|nr:nuclear transport factor 2 family protein [Cypionkella aquatica]GLS87272.1 hypothetical protein GCM10010873_22460 [Cypionkella aquatica]